MRDSECRSIYYYARINAVVQRIVYELYVHDIFITFRGHSVDCVTRVWKNKKTNNNPFKKGAFVRLRRLDYYR